MKPKTKSELMAEWTRQPGQFKKEREVKAIRKAMDDARAVMQDGLTRYVKKKPKPAAWQRLKLPHLLSWKAGKDLSPPIYGLMPRKFYQKKTKKFS